MINWAQLKLQAGPWAEAYIAHLNAQTAELEKINQETKERLQSKGLPIYEGGDRREYYDRLQAAIEKRQQEGSIAGTNNKA